MFREIKSSWVPATEPLVKAFANNAGWAGERPIKPKRIMFLRAQLDSGVFYAPTWYVIWLKQDGRVTGVTPVGEWLPAFEGAWVRMNGRHSSNMLNQLAAIPADMMVHIREFEADALSDYSALYRTVDSPRSSRSGADLVAQAVASCPQLCGMPLHSRAVERSCLGMVLFTDKGLMVRGRTVVDRLQYMNVDPAFVAAANGYAQKRYMKAGALAALYATWTTGNSVLWHGFWDAVVGKGTVATDPARLYHELLQAPTAKAGSPRVVMIKGIVAWNHWIAGSQVTRLPITKDEKIPDINKGVPTVTPTVAAPVAPAPVMPASPVAASPVAAPTKKAAAGTP